MFRPLVVLPFVITMFATGCTPEIAIDTYPPSLTDVREGLAKVDTTDVIIPNEPFIPGIVIVPEDYTIPGESADDFKTDLSAMEDLDDPSALDKHTGDTYSYTTADGDLIDLHAENDVSYDDVRQGSIGDCYFVAALSATLYADTNHYMRDGLIREIKGADGRVQKFAVRFYDYSNRPFDVTVDAQLFRNNGKMLYARSSDTQVGEEEWAIALIEKAYASWRSNVATGYSTTVGDTTGKLGYERIGGGGYAGDVMQALTGVSSSYRSMESMTDASLFTVVKDAIAANKPVAAATWGENAAVDYTGAGVYASHAYVVLGASEGGDGIKRIKLRNPWGYRERGQDGLNNGEFELAMSDFRRLYQGVYIGGGFKRDTTAPAKVTDLEVASVVESQAQLSFTATGDDGKKGMAAHYDLRISRQAITSSNFSAGAPVSMSNPNAAGEEESATIAELESGIWYAAVRVEDEAGNLSSVSNVVSFEVESNSPATGEQFDFESNSMGWTAEGLFFRTQEQGSWMYRMGDAGQDDYDIGEQPTGMLVSPAISLAAGSPVVRWRQLLDVESGSTYDIAVLEVASSSSSFSTWTPVWTKSVASPSFTNAEASLASYAGQQIKLRFRFDAVDSYMNSSRGWFIDDVVVAYP